MGVGVDVGEVEHELDVVHSEGVVLPVWAVAVPTSVGGTFVRGHIPGAYFAEGHGATHELFDGGEDFGVADDAVKFGGGDEGVVVGVLVVAVGVPAEFVFVAVGVKEGEDVLDFFVG